MTTRTSGTGTSRCAASPAHTPPTHRPRSGRTSGSRLRSGHGTGSGAGAGPGVVTPRSSHVGRPPRALPGGLSGVRAAGIRVGSGWHPMFAGRSGREDRAMDTHSSAPGPGATGATGPDAPAPDAAHDAPAPAPAFTPEQPHGFFAAIRRSGIYREDDRRIGGVASGLAVRFGVDPLLVRGILGVSILLGGLGLVLYGVGWALLPERRDGRIHLEETIAGRFDAAILGALTFVL